jgi:3-hydroxyisobutyrate dehydrogenase-like beta-hydroxyacid dehydrogenase
MSNIAFLGMGMMGSQMSRRLLDAGNDVTVWNRTPERAAPLAEFGAHLAPTPGDAVGGAEFVVTMLATPDAVDEVLFGANGAACILDPGQIWIDMSTVGPDEFALAAGRLPDGVVAVDAPVRGSVPEANAGRLQIFVGADEETFEQVRLLLSVLGQPRRVGPPGSGAATKLMVNLSLVASMVVLGEALALAEALGLDRSTVLDVLADSPIGPTVRAKRANIETSEYPASFKLGLATKDIRLVDEAAHEGGIQLPVAAAAREWMEEAVDDGEAEDDFSAVAATIVRHAGDRNARRQPVGAGRRAGG